MNGISQLGGYSGQQLAPQGLLGGLFGAPLGGMIGRGLGGMLGNASLGGQIGQMAGGIGGGLLPFQSDPMMQAYAQQLQQQLQQLQQMQQQGQQGQQQIAPQGFFGNLLGQVGQPLGGAIGGIFGQSGLGSQIGSAAGQLGRLLPFQQDPMQAYSQQQQQPMQQLAPQGLVGNLIGQFGQPAGSAIGGLFGQSGLGGQIGGIASQLGRLLPFQQDPIAQAYALLAQQQEQIQQQMQQLQQLQQLQQPQQGQQQIAPQGFFGNLLGQVGQPLGGAIGGIFGNSGLGSQIGGAAGQLGRLLPFQMDASQQQAWSQALQQSMPNQGGGQGAYGQQPGYVQQAGYGAGQPTVH